VPTQVAEYKVHTVAVKKSDEAIKMELQGLVNVKDFAPDIVVELAYATDKNVFQTPLYSDFNEAYLQKEAAQKLAAAQQIIKSIDHDLSLVVRDAARSQRIQELCWELAKAKRLQHLFMPPSEISMHTYGVAVDVSLVSVSRNEELDMGNLADMAGPLAAPKRELEMLKLGKLSYTQYGNRLLLRNAMTQAGFRSISNEWWHFEACSRSAAQGRYKPIR
jgi:D-alanyl-D-alanine dipeptidase